MAKQAARPRPKNPILRTRQPTLPPATRSRVALGLTAAAARGRFALQICCDCGARAISAARGLRRLSVASIGLAAAGRQGRTARRNDVARRAGALLPRTLAVARRACSPGLRRQRRRPCACKRRRRTCRVRVEAALDRAGQAALVAMPDKGRPDLSDDPKLREFTCDPRRRKVLVTDGKTLVGQALVQALAKAGADKIWIGEAEPWKKVAGLEALRALPPATRRSARRDRRRLRRGACRRDRRQGRHSDQHGGSSSHLLDRGAPRRRIARNSKWT